MKKNILFIFLSIFLLSNTVHSINYNFSNLNLENFIDNLKTNSKPNLSSTYIWQGSIEKVITKENYKEVTIIKAHWINKRELASYTAILKINLNSKYYNLKFLKQGEKILFVVKIEKIKDNIIPVCVPIFIKKL